VPEKLEEKKELKWDLEKIRTKIKNLNTKNKLLKQ
jgi:hypothetical protein